MLKTQRWRDRAQRVPKRGSDRTYPAFPMQRFRYICVLDYWDG
ncbi:MAG: hypothetical protein AB4290_30330 [Spirulina sp.]